MKTAIIGVDTGNSYMKTQRVAFASGLVDIGDNPSGGTSGILSIADKNYALSGERVVYQEDKTKREDYFILTLAAIAKELQFGNPTTNHFEREIFLSVGLPPEHIKRLGKSFTQYFLRPEPFTYTFETSEFTIAIPKVKLNPQGLSAAVPYMQELKKYKVVYVVDIGGYTTDVYRLISGKPDLGFVKTLDEGVLHLYDRIRGEAFHKLKVKPDNMELDELFISNFCPNPKLKSLAYEIKRQYAPTILEMLTQIGVKFGNAYILFCGGGSALFKQDFLKSNEEFNGSDWVRFIHGVHSNAKGYRFLAMSAMNDAEKQSIEK